MLGKILIAISTISSLSFLAQAATPGINAPPYWGYWTADGCNAETCKDTQWYKVASSVCGSGKKQSPIDIATADICYRKSAATTLTFNNVDENNSHRWCFARLANKVISTVGIANATDGYLSKGDGRKPADLSGAELTDAKVLPNVRGGPMGQVTHYLVQIYVHVAAEHTFNEEGFSHSGEMQLLFSPKEGSITGPVVMMSVFVEMGDPVRRTDVFLKQFSSIQIADSRTSCVLGGEAEIAYDFKFFAKDLLPEDTSVYFVYKGSHTTPTCLEVVTWIIFPKPIIVSPQAIATFDAIEALALNGEVVEFLTPNKRDVKPLNGRKVELYGSCSVTDIGGVTIVAGAEIVDGALKVTQEAMDAGDEFVKTVKTGLESLSTTFGVKLPALGGVLGG